MPIDESVYERFRKLNREVREALQADGEVTLPREYHFEAHLKDRNYDFQASPDGTRIFVGEELGDRGVVWFDELRFDELQNGWRAQNVSAWDLARSLVDKPTLAPPAEKPAAPRAKKQPRRRQITRLARWALDRFRENRKRATSSTRRP